MSSQSHKKTQQHLKRMLPSERSQSEKATYYRSPTARHSGKGRTTEMETDQWLSGVWGEVPVGEARRIFRVGKLVPRTLGGWMRDITHL